jgi:hypothetical protein
MKKILALLIAFFSINSFAQSSISLFSGTTTNVLAPNSVTQLNVGSFKNRKFDIDLKNTSATRNLYTVTRYDVLLNSGAIAYYCFGGSCYGAITIISPPMSLGAGKRSSDTTLVDPLAEFFMLTTDLDEGAVVGKSIVKYTFKNVAVAADSVQVTLTYNGTIGFTNIEKSLSSFDVYPNPANTEIFLNVTSTKNEKTKVVVINSLGSQVKEKDVTLLEGKNSIDVDLSNLPSGIYFARIGNNNDASTRKFVIK